MKHLRRISPVFILAVALSGCSTAQTPPTGAPGLSSLQKVSTGLVAFAKAVGTVQTTVIQANAQGLISDADTRPILTYCNSASEIGKQATAVTRNLSTLGPADGNKVLLILAPSITSIGTLVDKGTLGIKNQQTQQNIKAALLAVQTVLNTIQLTIAGGA
jgi:hypothetical protein